MGNKKDDPTFEEALKRLEIIVTALEDGETEGRRAEGEYSCETGERI